MDSVNCSTFLMLLTINENFVSLPQVDMSIIWILIHHRLQPYVDKAGAYCSMRIFAVFPLREKFSLLISIKVLRGMPIFERMYSPLLS
jgi:hypothetical protein